MPTREPADITNRAPTPLSDISRIASKTERSGEMDQMTLGFCFKIESTESLNFCMQSSFGETERHASGPGPDPERTESTRESHISTEKATGKADCHPLLRNVGQFASPSARG